MIGTTRVDPSESSKSLSRAYPIPRSPNRHVTRRICLRWSRGLGDAGCITADPLAAKSALAPNGLPAAA